MSSSVVAAFTTESLPTFTARDAAFLAAIPTPFVDPPPGVIPCYDCTNGNGNLLIVFALVGLFLSLACTGVRLYTKTFLTRALGWDDCMSPT